MMESDSLFERNLKVFAEHFPSIHARVSAITAPVSRLLDDNGVPVDIDLGSSLLHHGDGRAKEMEQARTFLKKPSRIIYNLPRKATSDSLIARRVYVSILDSAQTHGGGKLAVSPKTRTGFLIVLGVGMGYHLPILLDDLDVPHVIIVEPVDEFLLHSMRVLDWGEILHRCTERGTSIRLICEQTPERMTSAVSAAFTQAGMAYLDGSYFYLHYPLWSLTETRRRLTNEIPRQVMSRGYFEDERKMFCNTATNLHKSRFRLLETEPRMRIDVPAFLIGAGASLDDSAEFIREWRDRAIVFSSGSALQACLKHGIVPDFHTELENGPIQYDKMRLILEANADAFPEGRFTGITLVGSTTLNPRVAPFFDDVIFFFRDSSCSTSSLGRNYSPLRGIAPTVANTSLGTAACLGFSQAYLFGFDCGWRDERGHHAKETIYYTTDTFRTDTMKAALTVRGNFGGEIQTGLIFDWSRNMLEQMIAAASMKVFNCSDGAHIQGAVPMVPEAVILTNAPIDRRAMVDAIVRDLPPFEPGEFFKDTDFTPFFEDLDDYGGDILALIDRALAEEMPFHAAFDLFHPLINRYEATRFYSNLIFYTTRAELKLAAVLINRVPTEEIRHKVTLDFYREFRAIHEEMLAEARTILEEARIMFQGGPEPSWTAGLAITKDCSY